MLPKEFEEISTDSVARRARLLGNEIRVLKDESTRLALDQNSLREKIKENKEKIKLNNQLPYLVGNIVEVLDVTPDDEEEEDGPTADLDSPRQGKCVVLMTSTRKPAILPVVGLVAAAAPIPGSLVRVHIEHIPLPSPHEEDTGSPGKRRGGGEKPTEDYSDIGGLDKQIQVCLCVLVCCAAVWIIMVSWHKCNSCWCLPFAVLLCATPF